MHARILYKCLLLQFVASQLIKPFPFTLLRGGSISVEFIFMIMLEDQMKHSHHFFSSSKITLILTFILMNLQIYRTKLYISPTTDANTDRKCCLTASKLIKESEEHLYCKSCFLCVVYSVIVTDHTSSRSKLGVVLFCIGSSNRK
jgi:hypothetical protein